MELLLKDCIAVDDIIINLPTIGELDNFGFEKYWQALNIMTIIPSDIKWALWKVKIDYTKISEFELFIRLKSAVTDEQSTLLFKNINLRDFKIQINKDTNKLRLTNGDGLIIDENKYSKLADTFRMINGSKKKVENPKNNYIKQRLIMESKRKYEKILKERNNKNEQSLFEDLILTMVCSPEFPYDFETIKQCRIHQFMKSVQQTNKRIYALATIQGSLSGFVDTKKIKASAYDWMAGDNTSNKQNVSINV